MDKLEQLLSLAQKRKVARWPGYHCIGDNDYAHGAYECDFVSPYTKSAGNVDSKLFVLLQDRSSDKALRGKVDKETVNLGLTWNLPTNRRLRELLQTHFSVELGDVYATNLFPFIKSGGISSSVPMRDFVRAAKEFALPQISIIRPNLVICLGLNTFKAIRIAYNQKPAYSIEEAIASPFTFDMSHIWCQAHTGGRGQSKRGREQVERDWRKMKLDLPPDA